MAWSNVGSLKGPKGDAGETAGSGIPQGAIVLAYNYSPAAKTMQESSEWLTSGNFTITVNDPVYDSSGNPTPNATGASPRRLVLFAKA